VKTKVLLGLTAAGFVADALWRRGRAARLSTLAPSDQVAEHDAYHLVTAAGVVVDEAVRRDAAAHALAEGLDVLDLVPAGLDGARALDLVRRLDPATYRTTRLARGESAGHALLVSAAVAERAGVIRHTGLTTAELDELAARLKRFAPTRTDLVVVPGLAARPPQPVAERREILRGRWLTELPLYLTAGLGGLGVLSILAARRPRWGAVALTAAAAQPYLATLGTPLRPADRARFAVLRPVQAPLRWWKVARTPDRPDPDMPRLREAYAEELAGGLDRFFEPKRTDCPWCEGTALRTVLTSRDYQQRKPGVFRLDRCVSCGHVFQNPRLSLAGLDFYYRDYYDGLGAMEVERGFRVSAPHYRDRARMLEGHAEPTAWLDVGGGHGHFCLEAREIWPNTRFDALDMAEAVEEAERQGWVDHAHRGMFPDFADKLAGAYDVVSMHHYLEHTIDQKAELDAAAAVLPAGGHLLIEVPDPESPFGRIVGRWWHNWFQPQHLHFIPLRNLKAALAERGFETVAVERGPAHQRLDLLMVTLLMLNRLTPDPDKPWLKRRGRRARLTARTAAYLTAMPVVVAAGVADQLLAPVIRRYGGANTYRLLARKL
jgi:SAM-dependent methyltransferase